MFDFLRRRRAPQAVTAQVDAPLSSDAVQFIALRGTILTLRASIRLAADQPLEVRVPSGPSAMLLPGEPRTLAAALFEHSIDVAEAPDDFVDAVLTMLAEDARALTERQAEKRAHDRERCSFQVMSRDLEQFKALSADVSRVGIRLVTREKLLRGRRLELTLAFDDDAFPPLRCQAEVVWSRIHPSGFSAGLRFVGLEPNQQAQIERYNTQVKGYRKRFGL